MRIKFLLKKFWYKYILRRPMYKPIHGKILVALGKSCIQVSSGNPVTPESDGYFDNLKQYRKELNKSLREGKL